MNFRLPLLFLALVLLAAAAPTRSQNAAPQFPNRVWSGKWIWTEGDPSPRNSYTYFRKEFEMGGSEKDAKLYLTADSRYQVWVNGRFVGRGPVRSDRRWLYYDTWDVTELLKRGKNTLAILVHHYGEFTFQYMKGRGGVIADLRGFGGKQLVETDGTWKALRSEAWGSVHPRGAAGQERMSIQLGFSEVYDARKEPQGWKETAFDDAAWPKVSVLGSAGMEPWPNLVARDIPKMAEVSRPAVKVLEVAAVEPASGTQHVDLLPLMDPKLWAAAYLSTEILSPDRREVELKFGSDDALKVWLNGKPIVSHLIDRAAAPDQEVVKVSLEPGVNRLLAKVVQGHSSWEFYFRMGGNTRDLSQTAGPGVVGKELWSLAGPFTFPMDPTLKNGFEMAFPPEKELDLKARYRNSMGREFGWRAITPGTAQFAHVSQLMAAETRHPVERDLVDRTEKLIQETPLGAKVRTEPGADVSFLVDFGKEVTGFPHFRVRGARGGEIIDLGYGEVLHDPTGAFIPQSTDKIGKLNPDRDGVHYADRYLCRAGNQEFQTFDKRAFRYLQLDVRNAPAGLEIDDLDITFSTYPVEYKGAFQCSDERLNRIWEIGRWTCQLNMEDGYTDCPWRERGQWWGDARLEALINYYCFGDQKLIRKALRQKGQSLNEEGITWGVYPTDWDGGRLPSFTLIWVSTLWDTYQYTGDKEILKELYPKVRQTLDKFFAPRVGPRGLLKDVPYWVFIDWAPVDDKGESGALNAYYYDALRAAAQIGKLLSEPSAAEYERQAAAVKEAMNRHLWDAAAGAYRDSLLPNGQLSPKITQQTNSLCVLFDIAPAAEQDRILTYIYAPENKGKVVEAGSPYFSYYQLAALFHTNRHAQAMAYIRERWGRMLDWGATTWWEMWSPGASFCHGWSGGPTYNLGAEVLGILPLKPGFEEVLVAPHWVDLQFATGIVPTAKGDVKVAWQRDERGKTAALRVETGEIPAEVLIPADGEVLVNKKPRLPVGVTRLDSPAGTLRFRMERGGTALFEVRGR